MAKTTAPSLSFSASGSLAKTLVYSKWRGISYSRQHVVPANPNTTRQQVTRNLFSKLQSMWLLAPSSLKAPWLANATGRPYLGVNKFTGDNVAGIDTETPPTDFDAFIGSPGALGGLPPASLAAVGGALEIDVTLVAPATIPTGWAIQSAQAVAFLQQAPDAPFEGQFFTGEDLADPYEITITGLEAATEYVVSAWFVWTRPDGRLAYSVSLTDTATTS